MRLATLLVLVIFACQPLCLLGGVKGLFTRLKDMFPAAISPMSLDPSAGGALDCEHMCIDMNAVLHNVASRKYKNLEKCIANLAFRIITYQRLCRPRKSVVFALDGPAPVAKILAQRKRRLSSARSRSKKKGKASAILTTHITPGTPLMRKFNDEVLALAFRQAMHIRTGKGRRFFVSNSEAPGEGELKIIDWILHNVKNREDRIIIVAQDSDVVVQALALVSRFPFVRVIFPTNGMSGGEADVVDVSQLLIGFRDMVSNGEEEGPESGEDLHALALDMMFIITLCGNDYLPRLRGSTFETLLQCYKECRRLEPGFRLINGRKKAVDAEAFRLLLAAVTVVGPKPIINEEAIPMPHPKSALAMIEAELRADQASEASELDDEDLEDAESADLDDDDIIDPSRVHVVLEDSLLQKGETMWIMKNERDYVGGVEEVSASEDQRAFTCTMALLNESVTVGPYGSSRSAKIQAALSLLDRFPEAREKYDFSIVKWRATRRFFEERLGNRQQDARRFLEGVLFTVQMYLDGQCQDYSFQYPFPLAPTCVELLDLLRSYTSEDTGARAVPPLARSPSSKAWATPSKVAAMAVLSKADAVAMPEELRELATSDSSPVFDMYEDVSGLLFSLQRLLEAVEQRDPEVLSNYPKEFFCTDEAWDGGPVDASDRRPSRNVWTEIQRAPPGRAQKREADALFKEMYGEEIPASDSIVRRWILNDTAAGRSRADYAKPDTIMVSAARFGNSDAGGNTGRRWKIASRSEQKESSRSMTKNPRDAEAGAVASQVTGRSSFPSSSGVSKAIEDLDALEGELHSQLRQLQDESEQSERTKGEMMKRIKQLEKLREQQLSAAILDELEMMTSRKGSSTQLGVACRRRAMPWRPGLSSGRRAGPLRLR